MRGVLLFVLLASGGGSALPRPIEDGGEDFRMAVVHDHGLRSCRGELIFTAEEIIYRTSHTAHARRWRDTDIRMIFVLPQQIAILTYEPAWWKLGRDRTFRFRVMGQTLTPEVAERLRARIRRPLAMAVFSSGEKPIYEFPVRHRHRFGGCHGVLRLYEDRLVYESRDRPRDSRSWQWTDLQRVGRFGPSQVEIVTYEPEVGGPTRAYVFDVKEVLPDAAYDLLWEKVYGIARRLPPAEGERR